MTRDLCEWDCNLRCVHCGYVARRPETRRNCSVTRPPSLTHQLGGYALAVSRWLAAGRPVRSDEQVAELLATCQGNQCGKYDSDRGACNQCGCRVNKSAWPLLNKLRMATERCPKGIWGASELSENTGRLRVGFVTPNLFVGGVESWLCSLIGAWQKSRSVEVSGVAHSDGGASWSPLTIERLGKLCPIVSSVDIPGAHRVQSPLEACASIAAASDVLVVWSVSRDLLARIKRPGLRIVGVSHGCHDWWMRDASPLVDSWVAVSKAAVAPIPVPPEQVEVIPNGIDLDRCRSTLTREEARERLGVPRACKLLGYVGRLSPEKRIRSIVASVEHLPADWRLVVVGDGREADCVTGDRVTLLPATDAIGDVWRACDAAVGASEAEGYCLAAVEAIAAGVPLASTPVGIVPEIPGATLIDQPAEPRAIAAGVVEAFRRGVDARAIEWVTREATAERMGDRWAAWLDDARTADSRSPNIASHPV